jgi:hypothetical protein
MIEPVPTSIAVSGNISQEDLAKLLAAIESAGVIQFQGGKTLADVRSLSITAYDAPVGGFAASFSGQIRA